MQITWYGHSCFSVKDSKVSIVTDPHDGKTMGLKTPDVSADIVLMSHDHYDHNASDVISGNHEDYKFRNGEFSSHGIKFTGLPTYHDEVKGAKRGKNTMYLFDIDGISVCHCGDLGCIPSDDIMNAIKNVDILMVPVGGFYTMGLEETIRFVNTVNPSVVIPMHYYVKGLTIDEISGVEPFLNAVKGRKTLNVGKTVDITEIPKEKECWVFDL